MVDVIYKTENGVNMLGQAEYTVLPVCPVCGECTYSEDTCPFCRMNGVVTELEYDGAKAPECDEPAMDEIENAWSWLDGLVTDYYDEMEDEE